MNFNIISSLQLRSLLIEEVDTDMRLLDPNSVTFVK